MKRLNRNMTGIAGILAALLSVILFILFIPEETDAFAAEWQSSQKVKVAFCDDSNNTANSEITPFSTAEVREYLQQISDITGWKYEYLYGSYDEIYADFLNGEADIFPGLVNDGNNDGRILFPDRPMYKKVYCLSVLSENFGAITAEPASISGHTIGIVEGRTENVLLQNYIENTGITSQIVFFKTEHERQEAFNCGNIDILFTTKDAMDSDATVLDEIGDKKYYCAVNSDRTDIFEILNNAVNQIAVETTYEEEYNDAPENYTEKRAAFYPGNGEWLEKHDKLVVGGLENDEPYSYRNNNGEIVGVSPDLLNRMLEKLGININVEWKLYGSIKELNNALLNGDVDLVTPEYKYFHNIRKEYDSITLSNTMFSENMGIMYIGNKLPNQPESIITEGSRLGMFYAQNNYAGAKAVSCTTLEKGIEMLLEGDGECLISTTWMLEKAATKYSSVYNVNVAPLITACEICFACRSDELDLLDIINRGRPLIDDSEINYLTLIHTQNRYNKMSISEFFFENPTYMFTFLGLIIALILMILFIFIRSRVNMKIEQKIIASITEDFEWVYYVKLNEKSDRDEIMAVRNGGHWNERIPGWDDEKKFAKRLKMLNDYYVVTEDKERFIQETKRTRIIDILERESLCFVDFRIRIDDRECNYQLKFVAARKKKGLTGMVVGIHNADKEMKQEKERQEELRLAREKAIAANAAKTAFLSNMSHDIRTPMNAIMGYTNMARNHMDDTAKVEDCLNKIGYSSKHLLRLINEVLDMSQIESGKVEIHTKPMDITECSCVPMCLELAKNKNIGLTYSCGNVTDKIVYYDELHVNQIFMNILSNAIKYTNPGGKVTYRLEQISNPDEQNIANYRVTIEDNGIGMSKEFLNNIFDTFTRENNSAANVIEGTGLGMSIVKKLTDIMNGTINIESEKGVGTKVVIELPFEVARDNRVEASNLRELDPDVLIGRRVLLVEDNEMNREIATEILEDNGLEVDTADDGDVAVDKVAEMGYLYYDFILMDIQMPRMNGYDATKAIREIPHNFDDRLPIIAMTANAYEEDRQNAFKAGMDEHLSKPVDTEKLLRALGKYVDYKK